MDFLRSYPLFKMKKNEFILIIYNPIYTIKLISKAE